MLHEGRFCLASVSTGLAEVDGVGWLGDGRLFCDLAAVPLALTNAVIGLALGGYGSATTVDILQRKVGTLDALSGVLTLGCTTYKGVSRRCNVHSG